MPRGFGAGLVLVFDDGLHAVQKIAHLLDLRRFIQSSGGDRTITGVLLPRPTHGRLLYSRRHERLGSGPGHTAAIGCRRPAVNVLGRQLDPGDAP